MSFGTLRVQKMRIKCAATLHSMDLPDSRDCGRRSSDLPPASLPPPPPVRLRPHRRRGGPRERRGFALPGPARAERRDLQATENCHGAVLSVLTSAARTTATSARPDGTIDPRLFTTVDEVPRVHRERRTREPRRLALLSTSFLRYRGRSDR